MGSTFFTALVKKQAGKSGKPSIPATRTALREALEKMGCRRLKAEVGALEKRAVSLLARMHHQKDCGWLALQDDSYLGDPAMAVPFLTRLAAALERTVLYFANDGSGLRLWAMDGRQVQCLCCGAEHAGLQPEREQLSLFDALLPDDDARAELRHITAAEHMDAGLAAQHIGQLFGCALEVLMPEERFGFGLLDYELPPEFHLWKQPVDAPPALYSESGVPALTNPAGIGVHSVGGSGRGIRIYVQAAGYDAAAVDIPVAAMIRIDALKEKQVGIQLVATDYLRAVPQRCSFPDGSSGWRIDFPETEIPVGVREIAVQGRGEDSQRAALSLWLPFRFEDELSGMNRVRIEPIENPQAGAAAEFPLTPFRKPRLGSYPWLEGYEE